VLKGSQEPGDPELNKPVPGLRISSSPFFMS
jgi:hypothetical protein